MYISPPGAVLEEETLTFLLSGQEDEREMMAVLRACAALRKPVSVLAMPPPPPDSLVSVTAWLAPGRPVSVKARRCDSMQTLKLLVSIAAVEAQLDADVLGISRNNALLTIPTQTLGSLLKDTESAFSVTAILRPRCEKTFSLRCKSLAGKASSVVVASSDNVATVKALICEKGHPTDGQRLFYEGKEMEDGRTLLFYNIKKGNTLHLTAGIHRRVHEAPPPTALTFRAAVGLVAPQPRRAQLRELPSGIEGQNTRVACRRIPVQGLQS